MRFGRGKAGNAASGAPIELPERGATVALVPIAGSKIPARVLESGAGVLRVAITVPVQPLSPGELQTLVLEFHGENGRVRLTGTAVVEDPRDPDVLRLEDLRSVDAVQEREFVRVKSARPALVFGGPELTQVNSYTVDISGGGFLLAGADVLQVGDKVHFQLNLAEGELPVTGTGKVVRIDPYGHRGIVFDEIKELDRRRLIRFIFDCQRAELRRGLEVERHGD